MKRVLLIVYYWPTSGGSGVQRWLKFVKYLPEFGWKPTVITTQNGDYPVYDSSLEAEVPTEVKVIRTWTPVFGKILQKIIGGKSSIPYGSLESDENDSFLKKIFLYIRKNFIIPDMRKVWNKFAYKAAALELTENNYQAFITSGPPHSTHLIGLKLKKRFALNWIADFRDPWTQMGYLQNIKRWKLTTQLDAALEDKVIQNSDFVIAATEQIRRDFEVRTNIQLITNGFDHEDHQNKKEEIAAGININYFGILPPESSPRALVKAIDQIKESFTKSISLNLYGQVSSAVKKELTKYSFVHFKGYLPHKQMLELMPQSSILLLLINNVQGNKGIVPGKIYEYLGAKIPIMGIGPVNSDAASILEKTNSGRMFAYNQIDEIKKFILNFQQEKEQFTFEGVEKFTRKNLTGKLVEVLENL